tara:strand:- start:1790 stop:2080 length:291 start_codon:yes stop_codon:yes gene_type:complete
MIIRRCSLDHDIVIHRNNKKGMTKTIQLSDGTLKSLKYPDSYDYFLVVNGKIVKKSNSFEIVETAYVNKCTEIHGSSQGRIDLVKHKLVNNKVESK